MSDRRRDETLGFGLSVIGDSALKAMTQFEGKKFKTESMAPAKTPEKKADPISVSLPSNIFRPMGAESVDIRRLATIPNGSNNIELMSFTAPKSTHVMFTHYGVFTDALLASNIGFVPQIDGDRVLRYHGDPNSGFAINLSIGVDLGENAMIPCELHLKPGQTIRWLVTNNSGSNGPMGVRMTGYVKLANSQDNSFFFGG